MVTINLSHIIALASEYVAVDREVHVVVRVLEQLDQQRHVAHERRSGLEEALVHAVGAVSSVSLEALLSLDIKHDAAQRIIDRSSDV